MKKEIGKYFWQRVDELIEGRYSVQDLCKICNLNYRTIRNQRSTETVPDIWHVYLIALLLDTSMDYLYYGDSTLADPEVKYLAKKLSEMTPLQLAKARRRIEVLSQPSDKVAETPLSLSKEEEPCEE
ncbi:MAG: hypothetical protein LKE40_00840 [Spirochaetia bacterium]|jgi:hypothetical protein|nr:hypothetical protein [Spirochaetia bacterium]